MTDFQAVMLRVLVLKVTPSLIIGRGSPANWRAVALQLNDVDVIAHTQNQVDAALRSVPLRPCIHSNEHEHYEEVVLVMVSVSA